MNQVVDDGDSQTAVPLPAEQHQATQDVVLEQRQQRFQQLASLSRMTSMARQGWLDNFRWPVTSFVVFHAACVVDTTSSAMLCFLGTVPYSAARLQRLGLACGPLTCAGCVASHGLGIIYGPGYEQYQPVAAKGFLMLQLAPLLTFVALGVFSSEESVPFQNRFTFLLVYYIVAASGIVASLFSMLSHERSSPAEHPARTAAMGLFRALRFADGVSLLPASA